MPIQTAVCVFINGEMNCISFSLLGTKERYFVGGVRNAELAAKFCPDWDCVFSVSEEIPQNVIKISKDAGQKLYLEALMKMATGLGYYWRYYLLQIIIMMLSSFVTQMRVYFSAMSKQSMHGF
jgi:hypothetical protein